MKTRIIIIALIVAIFSVVAFNYLYTQEKSDSKFSDYEIEMMTDYESPLFTKISDIDLVEKYPSYIERLNLGHNHDIESKYNFYEFNYRGIKELHVETISSDGNCEIKAIGLSKIVSNEDPSVNFNNVLLQEPVNEIEEEIGEVNSCSGDPCSSCRFTRSIFNGEINGCKCRNLGGHCNHTVSEG